MEKIYVSKPEYIEVDDGKRFTKKNDVKNKCNILVKTKIKYKVVQDIGEAIDYFTKNKDATPIARYEFGDSMSPILESGEYCVLKPIQYYSQPQSILGKAVLCIVNGYPMTHMVWNMSTSSANGVYYLIGDSHGNIYGWTNQVFAVAKGTNIFEKEEID